MSIYLYIYIYTHTHAYIFTYFDSTCLFLLYILPAPFSFHLMYLEVISGQCMLTISFLFTGYMYPITQMYSGLLNQSFVTGHLDSS